MTGALVRSRQRSEQLEAVKPRQHEVEDDEVERPRAHSLIGGLTVDDELDLKCGGFEATDDVRGDAVVIFDHEDLGSRHPRTLADNCEGKLKRGVSARTCQKLTTPTFGGRGAFCQI